MKISDIETRTYQENFRTFVEKKRGHLVIIRELTQPDLIALHSMNATRAGEKRAEIQQWHDWAETQLLEAKLTEL